MFSEQTERPIRLLAVKLSPSMRRAVENAAKREGVTMSEVTRRALRDYLSRAAWDAFVAGYVDTDAPRAEVR